MTEFEIEDFKLDAELEKFIRLGVFNGSYVYRNQHGELDSRIKAYQERKTAHQKRQQALASLREPPKSPEARERQLFLYYGAAGTRKRQLGEADYDSEQRVRELEAQTDAASLALSRTTASARVEEVSNLLSRHAAFSWLLTKAEAEHDAAKNALKSYTSAEAEKHEEEAKAEARRQHEHARAVARIAEVKKLLAQPHQPMPSYGDFTGQDIPYRLGQWRANIRAGWEKEITDFEQQAKRA
jgi:hypothetical protein